MDNKIILIILFLLVGWNTYLQIYKTDKASECEDINSEVIDERIRFLKANDFTLNDAKIKELENNSLAQKNTIANNYNKLIAKFNEVYANLTSYTKKKKTDELQSAIQKMKNLMTTISQSIPQTYFYGPYLSPVWSWVTTPVNLQFLTHPTSTKLTIAKKSLVTLEVNGHINTEGQYIQVLFFVDNKPIPQFSPETNCYYNTHLTNVSGYQTSVNLSQETILQPGVYVFEVGIKCSWCWSKEVSLSGMGYTIKVQELIDPVTITI